MEGFFSVLDGDAKKTVEVFGTSGFFLSHLKMFEKSLRKSGSYRAS